jgi:hypothetical protein
MLLFAIGLGLCGVANATTYYVSNAGSDSNSGTSLSAPFQTISMAATVLKAGDTCFIRGGTYRETLTVQSSGTPSAPITFSAYNNESAVISGADVITGWSLYSGSIYQAPMGWDLGMGFNQIFVDGQMMYQARFPSSAPGANVFNQTLSNVTVASNAPSSSPVFSQAGTNNTVTSSDFNQADGYWNGCYFVGEIGLGWQWQWAAITSSSHTGTLTVSPGTSDWFIGTGSGYIFGSLNALDAPGEWHNKSNVLYLWPPASDSPNSHLVEAKRRPWTIDFNFNNYIVVSGLQLVTGAVNMDGNDCSLVNCKATYMSHFILFNWYNGDGDAFGGGSSGYQGITINGNDNLVNACTVIYTAGSGINIPNGSGNVILRCLIHETDYSGSFGEALATGYTVTQTRLWFNTAYNSGRDIIYPAGSNQDVRYNDVYNPGQLCKDLGIIYTGFDSGDEAQTPGTRIAYNWVHDNPTSNNSGGPGRGIYLDNYNRNYLVDHNVVWNCVNAYLISPSAPTIGDRFYNNTLFNGVNLDESVYDDWPNGNPDPSEWTSDSTQITSANNLYLSSDPSSQLVDPANDDFQLIVGAPAIDAGVVVPGITDGYLGSAPDLGAYEYGGVHWTAGVNGIAAEGPAVDDSSGASNLQGASATLNGQLSETFYQATQVIVYWGTSDGGTTASAWANSTTLNLAADGPFGATVTGLSSGSNYYYRCYASNVSGLGWAPASASFQTAGSPTTPTQPSARLINISTRAQVGTGGNILIPGFVIGGSGTETLLIRADGPGLTQFGVSGVLAKPSLTVTNSAGAVVASNTGWGSNSNPYLIASTAASVGAFALTTGSADCAVIANLPPGAYTVQVSGVGNTTGVALAEVYEVSANGTRLINISTRAQVGTGGNILIPGFVIGGSGAEQLLVRADGPSLTQFGVSGVLAQPSLGITNSAGTVVASNTVWGTNSNPTQITTVGAAVGAFALTVGSVDSAKVVSLQPGAYTVQVSGVNSSTGVALAEVYEVPSN